MDSNKERKQNNEKAEENAERLAKRNERRRQRRLEETTEERETRSGLLIESFSLTFLLNNGKPETAKNHVTNV